MTPMDWIVISSNLLTTHTCLVRKCLTTLSMASSQFVIRQVWVPGQSGISGKCKADELIKKITLALLSVWEEVGNPVFLCFLLLDNRDIFESNRT